VIFQIKNEKFRASSLKITRAALSQRTLRLNI